MRIASRLYQFVLAVLFVGIMSYGAIGAEIEKTNDGPPRASKLEKVVVVFKTHFDIGFTDMACNVVKQYQTTMIDKALSVCQQSKALSSDQRFVWTISGWPMKKILEDWDGQTPAHKDQILQALRDDRFVVHALPFSTHTELLEAEDLVRGLRFSSAIYRQLGKPLPRDAKMTDVPCHTWFIPTMLKHAGVEFLHVGDNYSCRPALVPELFWWEGPDGSRVLMFYSAYNYGTDLMPPSNWPYKTWLALIHTSDNEGPPSPESIKNLFDRAAAELPGVQIQIGRLSDFADAIKAENPDLPVVRADMPDTWIYGPMSDPDGAKLARNLRPLIAATETLDSQMKAWGIILPDASQAIADAYENSLLYGEHTWGGSVGWLENKIQFDPALWKKERQAGRYQRSEASWDEHTAYIKNAEKIVKPLFESRLAALAAEVKVKGDRIVVFNPLPWKRSGVVACSGNFPAVKPADGGKAIPAAIDNGQMRFVASDVPAMGYRSYVPAKFAAKDKVAPIEAYGNVLENSLLKVVLDPKRGVIASLIEKKTGRDLVDGNSPYGVGQYLYERFDENQVRSFVKAYIKEASWQVPDFCKPGLPPADKPEYQYRATSPANFTIRYEPMPYGVMAVMAADAGNGMPAVTTRVTLYQNQPYVDLEITLHDKPFEAWPEAGWLCLPFKIDQPRFRLGRLGSIVDPAKDVVAGSNRNLFGINTGIAMLDSSDAGVGMCLLDNPLVSLDTPGCWKYSLDFIPSRPVVFANLFNNQWSTNFRLWNSGTWSSRVRIWPIAKFNAESDLITPSLEARLPMLATAGTGSAGRLSACQSGLALSQRGAMVTAFGKNPDGEGTLLRVWELAGRSGECEITLPQGIKMKTVQPIDLRGRPQGDAIPVSKQTLKIKLSAFSPASFLIAQP